MNLDHAFFDELEDIPWLVNCGNNLPVELAHHQLVRDKVQAVTLLASEQWGDAVTEAQGHLTEYLTIHHASSYGGHWNKLIRQAKALVSEKINDPLRHALRSHGLPDSMAGDIIVELSLAAVEKCYFIKFSKVPVYFAEVLNIYKAGHMPCGWIGDSRKWPLGKVLVY